MVRSTLREINTTNPMIRDSHDASAEAIRRLSIEVANVRLTANRTSQDLAAKFGQIVMADSTSNDVNVALPSASLDDIGKSVVIKLWAGAPTGVVIIRAALDGRIDGNAEWRLTKAMESITVAYAGNNEWVIVSVAPGVGGMIRGYTLLPLVL